MYSNDIGSIDAILKTIGWSSELDVRTVNGNPWLREMEFQGDYVSLYATENKEHVRFAFTHDQEIKAVGLGSPKAIFMSLGMGNLLCCFVNRILASQAVLEFRFGNYMFQPIISNLDKTIQEHLAGEIFNWNSPATSWRYDPRQVELFRYILVCLTRFVVLHEAGHIFFDHYRTIGQIATHDNSRYKLSRQAGELVADTFALSRLQWLINVDPLMPELKSCLGPNVHAWLLPDSYRRAVFGLFIAGLVFRLFDKRTDQISAAYKATHPSPLFRLHRLLNHVATNKDEEFTAAKRDSMVSEANMISSSVQAYPVDTHTH